MRGIGCTKCNNSGYKNYHTNIKRGLPQIPCEHCKEAKALDVLCAAGIVIIDLNEEKNKVEIMENCDRYFSIEFSKNDLQKLINELQEMHNEMEK